MLRGLAADTVPGATREDIKLPVIHGHVAIFSGEAMLEHAALAEVEGSAGQALLQDGHDADKHLGADLRVELEELLEREALHLREGLLHKSLDLTLLRCPLLLVHGHLGGPVSRRHTVGGALALRHALYFCARCLLLRGSAARDALRILERDVAQENEDLIWTDKVVTIEIEPKTCEARSKVSEKFSKNLKELKPPFDCSSILSERWR